MRCIISLSLILLSGACGIYSFNDSSIPVGVKSIKVKNFDNKAPIVNPTLANNLTTQFKNKLQQQTKLLLVTEGRADYEVSGYVSDYNVVTSGINAGQASNNQLNCTFRLSFVNHLEEQFPDIRSFETDLNLSKQFNARLSLPQAEPALLPELEKEMVDLLFNKVFSNW